MKRQFLSIILSVTLLASAIAGAISVSIKSAFADEDPDLLYWADFRDEMLSLTVDTPYSSTMIAIFNEIESYWNNQSFNVWVMFDPDGNISLLSLLRTNGTGFQGKGWNNPLEYQLNSGASPSYFRFENSFVYANSSFRWVSDVGINISTPAARRSIIDMTTNGTPETYYCTPFELNASGWKCYSLRDMTSGNANGYSMTHNITNGHYIPPVVEFSWKKFNVGERWYVTTVDQNYMYGQFNDGEGNYLQLHTYFQFEDETEYHAYISPGTDLIRLPSYFVTGLENINNDTIYALDITELLDYGLVALVNSQIWAVSENSLGEVIAAHQVAYNNGFNVTLDQFQENKSLYNAWQEFNTYVTEYNTTHVIPEQLGDWLFNTNGSKLFPCSVQVPTHIWYNKFQTTSAPDNHIWRWGGSLIQEEGFQYSLFDTVIVGESDSGYGIRYFYDDTLTPSYNYIDEMLFANLIDSFDVVIIVPESEGILYDIPGVNVGPVGYTGSSSAGVVYTNDPLVGNTLQGFCILTERAIAKQQLWNFNEGITKLYDLEVKYIDSEDKWKDSFLLWSASMFDMVNSLDGRLTTINTNLLSISSLIESIKTAVDHIAYDDDPDNLQPWYLSLWNWITNFRPSDSDFSATLNQYDNNWDNFPELPAPSTVPLLPGGE